MVVLGWPLVLSEGLAETPCSRQPAPAAPATPSALQEASLIRSSCPVRSADKQLTTELTEGDD